jgi:hypothetical protein
MLTYSRAGGTFIGNIGGKALHFTARPAQSGAHPPPGNYRIHRPINDPIYGMVARMTPASDALDPLHFQMTAPAFKDQGAPAYDWIRAGTGMNTLAEKPMGDRPSALKPWASRPSAMQPTGFVFVLSSRPILGQNSLVIMVGFADLMDALTAEGGATVRVG